MKKFIGLLFVVTFYSTNGYALHASGLSQRFETGLIESNGSFFHFGDSYIDLALEGEGSFTPTTLTITDFIIFDFGNTTVNEFDSFTWDLETGLGIESECVSSINFCDGGDGGLSGLLDLTNISISRLGGTLRYVFNEEANEGGDVLFYDDVIVSADFMEVEDLLNGHLSISSVPVPGSVVLLSSGLMLLVGAARRKRLITK